MRKIICLLAIFAGVAASIDAASVAGKVDFVAKRGQKINRAETLVWLDPVSPMQVRAPETAQMATRGKALAPHVLAVPIGSTVHFPNDDPITHNLFSVSASNSFDLGLYRRGTSKSHTFAKPGVVNVYCNVHPNMSAVVHVLNTPFFAFTNAAGGFTIPNVGAGKYRLVAWNEQSGSTQSEIEVLGTGSVSGPTNLKLDGRNVRAAQHLNKFGQPYKAPRTKDY